MANIGLIRQLALQRGLDPAAVLAVANAEGLSGGIGDGGHAFGPFQLNNAGGVLTGIRHGSTPQQENAWAWSPAGLKFALDRIAGVARGQHGSQAIQSIVNRFERPAAPVPEIQRALAAYGRFASSSGSAPYGKFSGGRQAAQAGGYPAPTGGVRPLPPAVQQSTQPGSRLNISALIQGLINGNDISSTITGALRRPVTPQFKPMPLPVAPGTPMPVRTLPGRPMTPSGRLPGIAELLHEGVGGPTHSTGEHIHVASTNPQTMLAVISLAQKLGLRVGENPYSDPVDPVHAPNSYHNRTFPGLYHGRTLGEAGDFTGANMGEFYRRLAAMR